MDLCGLGDGEYVRDLIGDAACVNALVGYLGFTQNDVTLSVSGCSLVLDINAHAVVDYGVEFAVCDTDGSGVLVAAEYNACGAQPAWATLNCAAGGACTDRTPEGTQ